jgi:hypothetical protein
MASKSKSTTTQDQGVQTTTTTTPHTNTSDLQSSGSPSSAGSSVVAAASPGSATTSTSSATLVDTVQGDVQKLDPGISGVVEVPSTIAHITQPEQAVAALKQKVSTLHKLLHDVSHFATIPFTEIEALMADIKWLTTFIRSKV